MTWVRAACFLYEVTRDTAYRNYFDNNYRKSHLFPYSYATPFETVIQDVLLYYTKLEGATPSVITDIKTIYNNGIVNFVDNFPAYYSQKDPYLAHLSVYTWGSNSIKSCEGNMYFDMITYAINSAKNADAREAALCYVHYINGVNPLSMTYLSNMYHYGAENCVNTFYHSWFAHGSAKWDKVGVSTYGPPPGYVPGGANQFYDWDVCCPGGCGDANNNAACYSESISPPKGQPPQKSYKDFNTSWPIDSWQVTEPDCGYQINYIRLLSKFVNANMDCNGDINGTARLDTCNICTGGNSGIEPDSVPCNCSKFQRESNLNISACISYSSPSGKYSWTNSGDYKDTLRAIIGCDSILSIHLNIFQKSTSHIDVKACEKYSSPSGKFNWTSSGIFHDTIPNAGGCDSIMTINLEILNSSKDSISAEACKSYNSPSGKKKWNNSGTYTDTIPNFAGCDSIITINLIINNVNTAVQQSGDSLSATAPSAIYQWVNCGNNYSAIEGAANSLFVPDVSGNYAIVVTQNNCSDTSACFQVTPTGTSINTAEGKLRIYPNPSSGEFIIDLPAIYNKTEVEVKNAMGQSINKKIFYKNNKISLFLKEPKGIYFLIIKSDQDQEVNVKILLN